MKITAVESFLLSYPFPEPLRLDCHAGVRTVSKRDAMLVRVSTSDGIYGYAPARADLETKHAIDRIIAPFLDGRALDDPDALRVLFQQGPGVDAALSRVYSAVEIALCDALGKARGIPVSELIGGRVRDRIRLYGSVGVFRSTEEHVADALETQTAGFAAFKMRAGRSPEEDLAAARAIRQAAGAELDIMVDASAWSCMGDYSYSRDSIERISAGLREIRVRFLEEPLPSADHDGYARLRALDLAPLAAGRHEPNELRLLDLIQSAAVDYVQMDLISQGGYATARRLFPDIARAGLRFAFSNFGTALETIAVAQLGVCWPESVVRWLEYPCYAIGPREIAYSFPLSTEILKTPLTIDHGHLVVPRGPGLGVEIDESVIWRYPFVPELETATARTHHNQ
jgi:L-alanine-DL-glutamate epimerase-like enolase superfamily enzyme